MGGGGEVWQGVTQPKCDTDMEEGDQTRQAQEGWDDEH